MDTASVTDLLREVNATVIAPRFGQLADAQVMEKQPGDLVTVADREAEAFLAERLGAADPGALIVGEESSFERPALLAGLPNADVAWVIDPIDGTRNFVRGSDDHAIMLAEVRAGEVTRGFIFQPRHGRMVVAERGAGVTCDGEPVTRTPARQPYRGCGSRKEVRGWSDEPAVAPIRLPHWCCGIDYPGLVLGEWDFLIYHRAHPWDHLAGGLMVRELGGVQRFADGREYGVGVAGERLLAASDADVWAAAQRVFDAR